MSVTDAKQNPKRQPDGLVAEILLLLEDKLKPDGGKSESTASSLVASSFERSHQPSQLLNRREGIEAVEVCGFTTAELYD